MSCSVLDNVFNVCGKSRFAILHILKKKQLSGQVLEHVVGTRQAQWSSLSLFHTVESCPCGTLSRAEAEVWFALLDFSQSESSSVHEILLFRRVTRLFIEFSISSATPVLLHCLLHMLCDICGFKTFTLMLLLSVSLAFTVTKGVPTHVLGLLLSNRL